MTDNRTVEAYLSLMQKRGLGPARIRRLVGLLAHHCIPIEDAFSDAAAEAVLEAGLWGDRRSWKIEPEASRIAERLGKKGVSMVSANAIFSDKADRDQAPPFLFVKGKESLLSRRGVGFCGSRKTTARGLEVAADIAEQVAQEDLVCTSGGAKGVDTAAHTTALQTGGSTIVVLAEGILQYRMRAVLKEVWDSERAVLVSEFLPTDRWLAGRAMQRNRTICLFSDAVVLIEAKLGSGTFAAGEAALKMGLPLFTADYAAASEANAGNRELLGRGARTLRASRATGRANLNQLLQQIRAPRDSVAAGSRQLVLLDKSDQQT